VVHAASEIIRREDCKTFAVRARPDPGSCSLCTSMPGNCTLSETCRRVVERLVWVQQEFSLRYWRMLGPVPHFYPIAHVIGFLMCVDVALSVCFRAYCLCSCSCMPNCRNSPPDSKLVRGVGVRVRDVVRLTVREGCLSPRCVRFTVVVHVQTVCSASLRLVARPGAPACQVCTCAAIHAACCALDDDSRCVRVFSIDQCVLSHRVHPCSCAVCVSHTAHTHPTE